MFFASFRPALCALLLALAPVSLRAQVTLTPAEAEAQKCEDKIASVQRDVLGKYDDALGDLQLTLQKSADLEGALTVRTERQRLKTDQNLNEKDYVTEPKALRALQVQTVAKLRELISTLVQDSLPRLIEFKKSLTMAGKLDEAVNVRAAIERLQNTHVPITRADSGTVVAAETLLLAYSGDRARADKTYKGQKISVRGVLGGYRQDPADTKNYQLFLTGNAGSGWSALSPTRISASGKTGTRSAWSPSSSRPRTEKEQRACKKARSWRFAASAAASMKSSAWTVATCPSEGSSERVDK